MRLAVESFTPEYAERASGVPAEEIRRITREFAAADGAAAYGRLGLSTQGFGSVCQWAIHCLNILTGNFDREGGVLFPEPAIDIVGKAIVGRGHHDVWRSRVRGAAEFGGELPVSTMREEIETPGEGQIRAVLTVAGNPVLSTPDGKRLGDAFDGLDFMAAVDIYLNETTRHADVILPPTTALERDQYDLVFHALAVRNTARFTPAVFDKPEGALEDWEIFREIALRTAARLEKKKPWRKALTERVRLSVSPRTIITGLLLAGRRTTMRELRANPAGVDLGPLRPTMPARLQTRDKQIHLAPDLVVADLERLRETIALPAGDELLLIGRRHKSDNNSWMHNSARLTRGKPRHQLLMHPEDLAERGLSDGTSVRVASRVGTVTTEVRRDRRHDARGGLAPPRLRAPAGRHPDGQRDQGRRGLDQRPHRPRAPRRVGQRRIERRARHGGGGLETRRLVGLFLLVEDGPAGHVRQRLAEARHPAAGAEHDRGVSSRRRVEAGLARSRRRACAACVAGSCGRAR